MRSGSRAWCPVGARWRRIRCCSCPRLRITSALIGSRRATTRLRWSRARRRPMALRRDLGSRNSLAEGLTEYCSRLSVVRFGAAGCVPSRSHKRVVAWVPLPRVAVGRLGLSLVGCDLTNRSVVESASCCARRASSLKAGSTRPVGRRGGWRLIATEDKSNLRASAGACQEGGRSSVKTRDPVEAG